MIIAKFDIDNEDTTYYDYKKVYKGIQNQILINMLFRKFAAKRINSQ
jgi:hypothetical protein